VAIASLFKVMKEVKKNYNKSIVSQLCDIILLRFGKGKLGISEYYDYKLFDDQSYSLNQKNEFIGWRRRFEVQNKFNSVSWYALSQDKLIFQQLMMGAKLPVPELQAVYCKHNRYTGEITNLKTRKNLKYFLSKKANYPFFVKPIHSWHGRGGRGVISFDDDTEQLLLLNQQTMSLADFYQQLSNEKSGYLVQSLLQPHSDIVNLCGKRLCTARIWVLYGNDCFTIFRALLKITVGTNMVDNTQHGKTGNLYGPIDIEKGTISRQIKNAGYCEVKMKAHPDTNQSFDGFKLPSWEETKALVCKAAKLFPGLKLQPWDVAFTSEGPILIELSVPGDIDGPQYSEKKGLWDKQFDAALRQIK